VNPDTELAPETHKTGSRLADKAVAFSALFVSLCSLGIALHHGRTMQRLVEANSRPFIQITTKNTEHAPGSAAAPVLTVMMSNPGAGAARIERFTMLVDDRVVDGLGRALLQLAGVSGPSSAAADETVLGPMTYAELAPSYLKAGSEEVVLRWPRTAENAAVWDKVISAGSGRVKYETCYCSIFDECWTENSHTFRPTPVKSCG
jgi:hypothetical protein